MLPSHLIMIRHGESEGNVVSRLEHAGEPYEHLLTDEYVNKPGRSWELSEKGKLQAQALGVWLRGADERGEFGTSTGRLHYTSPFVRTRQTAGHLGLVHLDYTSRPSVRWRLNRAIRERDWGDLETFSKDDYKVNPIYLNNLQKRQLDPLYWRPPGGESIADVADNRVRNFLDTLHREASGRTVFAVSHGEFIRATLLTLLRANDETYMEWEADKSTRIKNCEAIHFTRIVPEESLLRSHESPGIPGKKVWPERPYLTYMRRAVPKETNGHWAVDVSPWEEISFTEYDNEGLFF